MTLHRLVPLLALALDLVLMGSALASARRNARNVVFALLALAMGVWSLGVFGLRSTEEPGVALQWEWFLHVGVVAIPALFFDYIRRFLDLRRGRGRLAAAYGLSAIFLALVPTDVFMSGVTSTAWGFAPVAGPAYVAFLLYFHGYLLAGLGLLFLSYRATVSSFRRNRILLVIVGVAVSVVGGFVDFARFAVGWEWLYPVGIPCNMLFALALGIAIVRYRLVDVGTLGKRTMIYIGAVATLTPLLVMVLRLADVLIPPGADTGNGHRRVAILAVSVVLVALPLLRKLDDSLDRLMFRRRHAVRNTLHGLSRAMSATLELEDLGRKLTEGLADGIPTLHASLYLSLSGRWVLVGEAAGPGVAPPAPLSISDELTLWLRVTAQTLVVEERAFHQSAHDTSGSLMAALEERRVALIAPLFIESELAGMLFVGEKLSGEIFDPDEIELLEVLVGQAATALRNVRLYEKLKMEMEELRMARYLYGEAQESDRAKEQFLATLAHELRNPLSPIVTALHVAAQITDEPKLTSLLGIAKRQAHHLARLMEDLLDVSRIRAGKVTLRREAVDVRTVVERCFESLATSGRSKGRDVEWTAPAEPVVVDADPDRLLQVLANLVDNALKYTPTEGRIRVAVEREPDHAVVRVQDTGAGIAADVIPHVFDIFTQGEHQPRTGLGLGLALVRALVEQHGGSVGVRSAGPGRGSEFIVRLPLSIGIVTEALPAAEPFVGKGCRVLLVEDHADARNTLRLLLEMSGHRVEITDSGEEALRLATTFQPDIAVIDIGLPDIDGYQVARRLRSTDLGRATYLVALTGYGQPDDRRRALDSGFDEHVVKPIDPDHFLTMVGRRHDANAP